MLWNAATVLPLPGSDGKTAIDTLSNTVPAAAVANFLAVAFVVSCSFHRTIVRQLERENEGRRSNLSRSVFF